VRQKEAGVDRVPVKSSNVKAIGYDSVNGILEVEFHRGGVYQYGNVPSKVHEGLMASSSKGKFLREQVIKRFRGWHL
jgi:hypothetical protein